MTALAPPPTAARTRRTRPWGRSSPLAWPLGLSLVLGFAHLGWAAWDLAHPPRPPTTYVFTPLVDVWPEGPALPAEEGQALGSALRGGIDAREMSQAYARLGSTLSLAELLTGVEALEREGRLTSTQRAELAAVLSTARADHAALVEIQRQILDLELGIAGRVAAIRDRARVAAPTGSETVAP